MEVDYDNNWKKPWCQCKNSIYYDTRVCKCLRNDKLPECYCLPEEYDTKPTSLTGNKWCYC